MAAEGTVLRAVPGEVLELTFSPTWDDEVRDEPGFRIVWRIEPAEARCIVTVEHYDLDPDSATARQVGPGSLYLVSNLKTWVETGSPMGA